MFIYCSVSALFVRLFFGELLLDRAVHIKIGMTSPAYLNFPVQTDNVIQRTVIHIPIPRKVQYAPTSYKIELLLESPGILRMFIKPSRLYIFYNIQFFFSRQTVPATINKILILPICSHSVVWLHHTVRVWPLQCKHGWCEGVESIISASDYIAGTRARVRIVTDDKWGHISWYCSTPLSPASGPRQSPVTFLA